MPEQITSDASFLINLHLLGWLELLCKIYDKVLITPTVKKECSKIRIILDRMPCMVYVKPSNEEQKFSLGLDKELKKKFPGEHRGEVEALVVAHLRNIPLLLSDNSPWYLRERHKESLGEGKNGHCRRIA